MMTLHLEAGYCVQVVREIASELDSITEYVSLGLV